MLGQGLLTAALDNWKWQRRAAAPAFQPQSIAREAPVMGRVAARAVERWRAGAGCIDACEEMMAITFEIILETMLGGARTVDAAAMSRAFALYLKRLGKPTLADLLGAPDGLREAMNPKAARAIDFMHGAVDAMIATRRGEPARGDLVDMLIAARDGESGRAMSDRELRDNLITFLAAGHETTALALAWSVYLVSQHEETEARILAEVAACAGDAPIDADIAQKLTFTRQVVEEAMRLYPPVPVLTRMARRDGELAGHKLKAGDTIVIPIYALHRHRAHWRNADHFDPDRFSPQAGLKRQRFTYMPFGAGPRVCIGASFALTEATIVLATLLRETGFALERGHPIRPLLRITMRPQGGLPMRLGFRDAGALPLAA
jgi:cytochrome P450